MAKGKIDPAFQAAPFLGESTHDPIEFQRRHKAFRYQQEKERQEKIEENIAKGLEKLMIDVKSWEDKEGFNEIVTDHDKVIKGFLDLSKKGLNVTSPKTSQEIMAYKAITEAQQKIMNKVDVWNRQKGTYDLITQAIKQEALKPGDQRRINFNETMGNVVSSMKGKSILDREMKIDDLLAFNVLPMDVIKKITDSKEFFEKPKQTQIVVTNPETGMNEVQLVESLSPEQEKENVRKAGILYEGLTNSYKETIRKMRESDTSEDFKVMSDKDYFTAIAVPTYREKFIRKPVGTGAGFSINIGNQKVNLPPGTLRPEPLTYGEGGQGKSYINSYWWPVPGKSITVPVGTAGSEQFMGAGWSPITRGGTVEATLYLYDPDKDEFVFNVTSNQRAPWVENNRPVSIPRSVIGDILDEVRIKKDGKVVMLKDIFGAQSQPQEDTSVFDIFSKKTSEPPPLLKRK